MGNMVVDGTHVVHQHGLDTVLDRRRARIAAFAGSLELQQHVAILKATIFNITPVGLEGRADARVEEFLDHADDLTVVGVVTETVLVDNVRGAAFGNGDNRLPSRDGLGNGAKDVGLDVLPAHLVVLADGDEVGAIKHRCDAVNVEEIARQRREVWWLQRRSQIAIFEVGHGQAGRQDSLIREELERIAVGRGTGLDEDTAPRRMSRVMGSQLRSSGSVDCETCV